MLKRSSSALSNRSEGVVFLLNGAQKRRSMSVSCAKIIQGDIGLIPRLFAIKQA